MSQKSDGRLETGASMPNLENQQQSPMVNNNYTQQDVQNIQNIHIINEPIINVPSINPLEYHMTAGQAVIAANMIQPNILTKNPKKTYSKNNDKINCDSSSNSSRSSNVNVVHNSNRITKPPNNRNITLIRPVSNSLPLSNANYTIIESSKKADSQVSLLSNQAESRLINQPSLSESANIITPSLSAQPKRKEILDKLSDFVHNRNQVANNNINNKKTTTTTSATAAATTINNNSNSNEKIDNYHQKKSRDSVIKRPKPVIPLVPGAPSIDELPTDLCINFSKWFYKDIKQKKSTRSTQILLNEQLLTEPLITDDLDDIKLLTQGLDEETKFAASKNVEPIKRIYNYKLLIKEKLNKGNINSPSKNITRENNTSTNNTILANVSSSAQHRPKPPLNELTLTIETSVTTIDCRPMIKKKLKLETIANGSNSNDLNLIDHKLDSLIAPDEDCDDSDEEQIMEIDCD